MSFISTGSLKIEKKIYKIKPFKILNISFYLSIKNAVVKDEENSLQEFIFSALHFEFFHKLNDIGVPHLVAHISQQRLDKAVFKRDVPRHEHHSLSLGLASFITNTKKAAINKLNEN
jgi:hypothetical protein